MSLVVKIKAGGATASADTRLMTRVIPLAKGEKGAAGDRLPHVHNYLSTSVVSTDASIDDIVAVADLQEGVFFNNPTGPAVQEQKLLLRIRDNGFSQSIAWDTAWRGMLAPLPTSTEAGKLMYLGFMYNAVDGKWDLIAFGNQV